MTRTKVLVTGGCGFIGREVVKQLLEKNYQVLVLDDFSNSTPLKQTNLLKVIRFDLTKQEGIIEHFKEVKYCIHLAARVGGIKYMNLFQAEILRDDIMIDLNVTAAASLANTKIVYASTVIIYDQLKNPPFREDQTVIVPKSTYGFSKLVGEKLCQVLGKDKNLKFSIGRICNVYGINPNKVSEKKLHVIPDLVRKITQDKVLKLMGGGKQIKTFVHVTDVASALILMMEKQRADGEIFNVGSNDRYQIMELAKMIWRLVRGEEIFHAESINIEGTDFLNSIVNVSKIEDLLGWKAKRTLKKSLPEIVKRYQRKYETKVF